MRGISGVGKSRKMKDASHQTIRDSLNQKTRPMRLPNATQRLKVEKAIYTFKTWQK